ncbi:unnamed protein product [Darwinula stevensoni]|uniref:Chromo domain-containing protein n=1 Tax=Darwinula stevensoni TaxID=69355 RepID=A0A7R9A260_9CRUS|nr:unnamed protein product [Darwinula stevensoni]CAG0885005.1 unnamed protein product [Darwinula stevensoni]
MARKVKFAEGEKILCYHGPLIYEAKCLKVSLQDRTVKYLVHYSGWKKNWDEWVSDARMLKVNEVNLQKQKELIRQHKMKIKSMKGLKSGSESKQKEEGIHDESQEKSDHTLGSSKVETLPEGNSHSSAFGENSKNHNGTGLQHGTSSSTPCAVPVEASARTVSNVNTATNSPENSKKSSPLEGKDARILSAMKRKKKQVRFEMADRQIFPIGLDWKVVKRTSLQQLEFQLPLELKTILVDDWDMIEMKRKLLQSHPSTPMSQIYGIAHLIRTFGKFHIKFAVIKFRIFLLFQKKNPVHLGPMMRFAQLSEASEKILIACYKDLIKWLAVNADRLFNEDDYGIADPAYHRRLLGFQT